MIVRVCVVKNYKSDGRSLSCKFKENAREPFINEAGNHLFSADAHLSPAAEDAADAKDLASIEAAVETPAVEDTGVSPEIVAAIMGAIQMKLDAEVGEGGYRLRNIRRAEWRHM